MFTKVILSVGPLYHWGFCASLFTVRFFSIELCGYISSHLRSLCLTVTSVCVVCLWHWISVVFFMWVLFHGVFQHGLFRTVFNS